MMRSRVLLYALLLALGAIVPEAHPASRDDRKTLVVRGRVSDREGWPIAGSKVTSSGSHKTTVNVDRNGAYVLLVPVGSLDDVAKRPFEVTVDVVRRGWTFSLPGGASRLGIGLSLEDAGGGVARGRVRSNEPSAATAVAEALVLDGNASALVEMNFIGIEGTAADTAALKLEATQEVTLTGVSGGTAAVAPPPPVSRTPGVKAPAVAAPATVSSPPPTSTSASSPSPAAMAVPVAPPPAKTPAPASRPADPPPAAPRADTVASPPTAAARTTVSTSRVHPGQKPIDQATTDIRLSSPPVVYPQPPRTRPAPNVPSDTTCTCRVYGTIEVFSEKRLPEPTRFDVRVIQIPAFRDTVELFMGSPRAFDFRTVPCGALDLDIRTIGSRRFTVTSRDGREPLHCERGAQRHMRIVLEPR